MVNIRSALHDHCVAGGCVPGDGRSANKQISADIEIGTRCGGDCVVVGLIYGSNVKNSGVKCGVLDGNAVGAGRSERSHKCGACR